MKLNPAVVIIAIFLFFAIVFLAFVSMPKGGSQVEMKLSDKQAILDDARIKFPQADKVDIVNITETSEGGSKYLTVKVRVTENYSSTCPKRYHLIYY